MNDTFGTRANLVVDGHDYRIHRLDRVDSARLPYALKILLENLLRHEDGRSVRREDIEALLAPPPRAAREIAFTPSRVLLQDFTGVPAVVDLAAMRAAMRDLGGDPGRINPLQAVELVIDHSVQVDDHGSRLSLRRNADLELARNAERYRLLKWGQQAFERFRVVPPGVGIVHQVNLEHLARVVFAEPAQAAGAGGMAYPDTLVGTDSHTTMINGLGVLGWGVGGIEAEAAMLGQPVSMLVPDVLGVRLSGALPVGTTATDLVLTVTEVLRRKGVVGKLVEFFGEGLASLSLADRATIANMAPEYGATSGLFPVDDEVLRYLRLTGRSAHHVALVEAYCKEQGLFHHEGAGEAIYADVLDLDLSRVEPSLAGPTRPQDRVALGAVARAFVEALPRLRGHVAPQPDKASIERLKGEGGGGAAVGASESAHQHVEGGSPPERVRDGSVVIAAITSCTNTSNPSVMIGAGLLAKKALERGLRAKPWVKTSLAPGSRVVTEYLAKAGLAAPLEELGFFTVGYGCTTCIGNSGPLPPEVSEQIASGGLVAVAVLSGNRNFEGRIHPEVRANYLASPPLVVAYARAGRIDLDLDREPIGRDASGAPVMLSEIWPTREEIERTIERCVGAQMFSSVYRTVFEGDEGWAALEVARSDLFEFDPASTYVKLPPYFDAMQRTPPDRVPDILGARVLAALGDSITTDHISPAGSIAAASPAGRYLIEHGVPPGEFNSYGARRGNHEVMIRGTFANVRLKNRLVPGLEGGVTRHLPSGETMSIFEAAMRYQREGVPSLILAGKEYGSGSSRDWAAKGPRLLGVRAVLAESYERIHRSNLVGMGVLPLQFSPGESASTLGLTGEEIYDITGIVELFQRPMPPRPTVTIKARRPDGVIDIEAIVRIDTPQEALYYRHGGILPYVLRDLLSRG
ncbi:MAG: aconitate hydratase AcnA [Byssovorax sp.]